MKKFYHVADKENLPSILKHGLTPNVPWGDDTEENAVFLWDSLAVAKSNCGLECVVLEVDILTELVVRGMWNEANLTFEYFTYGKISPQHLKIVYEEFSE